MSLLDGWYLGDKYSRWMKKLEGNRASDIGKTECQKCGYCCAQRPCIPTPAELEVISKFLNMDIVEMVKKYFVGDRIGGSFVDIIFPAKDTQLDITGTFIDYRRTYDTGYCVFFDKLKGCKIEPVKPVHARTTNCWDDKDTEEQRENAINAWKDINIRTYGIVFEDENNEE